MWKSLFTIPLLLILAACGSDSSGDAAATTYSISGTLDTGATASSLSIERKGWDLNSMIFGLRARTSCDDGQFYSVFCMTFTSPPVAAEGDVSCSGTSGSFTVAGLPLGEPIFCVVRRYADATTTSGTNVGAIEIPTANLSGASDTIVGNGNLTMAVTMNSSGTITATVTGSQGSSSNSTADSFFTPANVNGNWTLTCNNNNGGSKFSAGACKCFLGEAYYGTGNSYMNQEDCLNDPNGAGAGITSTVSLPIEMNVYPVTTNGDIPMDNNVTIPSGTSMKAISIWKQGSRTGGEGVTTLGGKLVWDTTVQDPKTPITWTTAGQVVKDGSNVDKTVAIPTLTNPNSMTHGDWVTWVQSVGTNASGLSFDCNWGPPSHAQTANTDFDKNIECINQVLDALSRDEVGATIPRIRIQPFCDQNGCVISSDTVNDSGSIVNTNAFKFVRFEFENWNLDYPANWTSSDDYTSVGPKTDGIGVGPKTRFVFEPLEIHPNGAGFRQGYEDQRHYNCVDVTPGEGQVQNSACTGSGYWELVCYTTEQMAIKFIGTSSPMDVIFDSLTSTVAARLIEHTAGGPQERQPVGTNVISMCNSAAGLSSFTFFATGSKD